MMCMSLSSWLKRAMKTPAKQEDHQEDNDARVVIFLIEKTCEDTNKARRRP